MSQIVYRGNLSAKSFPLLTDFQGRTVIVRGADNDFNRSLASTVDLDQDVGVPIMYYCHNVLPAPYGFSSVGYEETLPAVTDGSTAFTTIKLIRSNPISSTVAGPRVYFAPSPAQCYEIELGDVAWTGTVGSPVYTVGTEITYATVQGITYIFFAGIGCYKYDSVTQTMVPVTMTALTAANILGIASYQGYMIAYDSSSIYWSSVLDIDYTLNSVDFTPSLVSGAGQLKPEGARGPITVVMPATFGLAIYTTSNIVSAVYSGNSRYPFNFKEIVSSGGCTSQDLISYDANTGNQYAYTTSGLQILTATATQTVFPELTDFLAGQILEDFNETTLAFSATTLTSPMKKKIVAVADRYLIFSYGISSLTHAIVYDMAQKRYGKLKIPHVDCFEYEYLDPALADAPRKSIAFLRPNGSVTVLNPSVTFATSNGVILLGKFQYVRSRLISLEGLEFQTVGANQTATAYDLSSISGGTLSAATGVQGHDVTPIGETQKEFKFHKTGTNHSILIVGGFSLSSFILTFHIHGRR